MANGLPTRLSPFFGNQAAPFPPSAPSQQAPSSGFNIGGFNIPMNILGVPGLDDPRSAGALQGFSQGFLQGDQSFADALTRGVAGGFSGFAGGEQIRQQQAQEQQAAQAAAQQQALENLQAQQAADLAQSKERRAAREFGITTGLKQQTEQRLLTKDQRDAQDIAFKQDNAVQQLQLNQATFRLDQATSAPEKVQVLQAMGLDPASPEGRELLTASLTKPQVQINQPKLSPGQIPIDPNDLSKGTIKASDIGTARTTAAKIETNLQRYEEALREVGAETLPGPAKDRLRSTRTQLLFDLKTLNELGALQAPDLELMKDLLLDPTSITSRVGNAFGALAGNSLGERALANIGVLRQQVADNLAAITGQVGPPAGAQAPAAPAATPANPANATDAQLLQSLGLQ